MYIGGFGLAAALFICAALFFFIFTIPSVHGYFRKNRKKGLAGTAAAEEDGKEIKGPKRITRTEYESLTEIISIPDGEADAIPPEHTEVLGENLTGDSETDCPPENATEILK